MWLSFHMFCHDTGQQKELIEEVSIILVKLVTQKKINKWFFIRYWIGSPHVRIRIETNKTFTLEDKTILVNALVQINSKNTTFQLNRYSFYLMNKAGLNETNLEEKEYPWFPSGSVEEIEYIPEVYRYGGDKLIGNSEDGFYVSSLIALKFLDLSLINKILITSAVMKLITEKLIDSKLVSPAFNDASLNWRRTFSISENTGYSSKISSVVNINILEKTERVIESYPEIQSYIAILGTIKAQLNNDDYFKSILFSHFHMFNNRLGISPATEMFIFSALQKETEFVR